MSGYFIFKYYSFPLSLLLPPSTPPSSHCISLPIVDIISIRRLLLLLLRISVFISNYYSFSLQILLKLLFWLLLLLLFCFCCPVESIITLVAVFLVTVDRVNFSENCCNSLQQHSAVFTISYLIFVSPLNRILLFLLLYLAPLVMQ